MCFFQKVFSLAVRCAMAAVVVLALMNLAPRLLGVQPYIILSGSMEPAIKTGAIVYINRQTNPGTVQAGEIIAYRKGEAVITHRVVDGTAATVTTKGDANKEADLAPVPREAIIGTHLFSIPSLGFLYEWFHHPGVYFTLIALFAVDMIASIFCDPLTSKNKKQEKKDEKKKRNQESRRN